MRDQRIREDYLRILRFFRFGAQYGDARAPDAEGLAAATAEKAGLSLLSGERIRSELLLLLAAPGAVPALQRMRDSGLIAPLLGVAGNVELVERLAAIEQALNRPADAVLRLAALASDAGDGVRERLRLSTAEAERLAQSWRRDAAFDPRTDEAAAKAFIYRHGAKAFTDGALIDWARSADEADDKARARSRIAARALERAGSCPYAAPTSLRSACRWGRRVGRIVASFEKWWIGAGYPEDPERVRAKLEELARGELKARRDA